MSGEDEWKARIESRLEAIVRLLAAPLVKDRSLAEAVGELASLGLDRQQIASICGTSPDSVRARLSEITRRRGAKTKARKSGATVPTKARPLDAKP